MWETEDTQNVSSAVFYTMGFLNQLGMIRILDSKHTIGEQPNAFNALIYSKCCLQRIRSIIARNQRALSGHGPDSA